MRSHDLDLIIFEVFLNFTFLRILSFAISKFCLILWHQVTTLFMNFYSSLLANLNNHPVQISAFLFIHKPILSLHHYEGQLICFVIMIWDFFEFTNFYSVPVMVSWHLFSFYEMNSHFFNYLLYLFRF